MWFVGIGSLMLLAKLADLGPMSHVAWWWVAVPFAAAAVWWVIADSMGITQRRTMAAETKRADERRERQYENLGMRAPPGRRGGGDTSQRSDPFKSNSPPKRDE